MQPQKSNKQLIKHNSIVENLSNELNAYVTVQAKHNAANNLPSNQMEYQILVLNTITEKTNKAIFENQQKFLPISGMTLAYKIKEEARQKLKPICATVQDKEIEISQLEQKAKSCTPYNRLKTIRKFIKFCIAIISATEGWFANEAMQYNGFPFLASVFGGAGIAVSIALITHIGSKWCKNAGTKLQFSVRTIALSLPIIIALYYLGVLRADGYKSYATNTNLNPNEQHQIIATASPEAITSISVLLFIATLIASIKYAKTKEEEGTEKWFTQLQDEIKKHKKEADKLIQRINTIEKESKEKQVEGLQNFETAVSIEKQLHLAAYQSVNVFNQVNIRHRSGIVPPFFGTKPNLQLLTFFNPQNQNNENINQTH